MSGPRVTNDIVEGFLVWGRNYKEIEGWRILTGPGTERGRKWLIELPGIVTASGAQSDDLTNYGKGRVVPASFVLTSREALAFGYGLAAAGPHEARASFARREWGWDD